MAGRRYPPHSLAGAVVARGEGLWQIDYEHWGTDSAFPSAAVHSDTMPYFRSDAAGSQTRAGQQQ